MTEQWFDVLLCYQIKDRPAVGGIAKQLESVGLLPWLDVWLVRPGHPWQYLQLLKAQIQQIKSAAVFVGQDGTGSWENQELQAFLSELVNRNCPVIPVLLPNAPLKPELPMFLKGLTWVDFRANEAEALRSLIWRVVGRTPRATTAIEANDELAALRQELQLIKVHQLQVHQLKAKQLQSSPDDLSSEKGIDYSRLRDLLKAQNFKDADYETCLRMREAVGREDEHLHFLESEEILNFPCTDLKTIDRLWVKYSDGKFGFSVQKDIYAQCGGRLDGEFPWDKVYVDFEHRVGWRVHYSPLSYSQVTFNTSAPIGHLPVLGSGGLLNSGSYWCDGDDNLNFFGGISCLASALVKCDRTSSYQAFR